MNNSSSWIRIDQTGRTKDHVMNQLHFGMEFIIDISIHSKQGPRLTSYYSFLSKTPQQIEKAFQKQQGIFQNAKVAGKKSVKNNRWYKDVGLGFKTPKEAIEGHYIDKKCPFTGDVSIRGRILNGEIISTKMKRTIIIRREYLHFISKYNRYEKRHKVCRRRLFFFFYCVVAPNAHLRHTLDKTISTLDNNGDYIRCRNNKNTMEPTRDRLSRVSGPQNPVVFKDYSTQSFYKTPLPRCNTRRIVD